MILIVFGIYCIVTCLIALATKLNKSLKSYLQKYPYIPLNPRLFGVCATSVETERVWSSTLQPPGERQHLLY